MTAVAEAPAPDPEVDGPAERMEPWITEPGIYADVTEGEYHRDPVVGGSLSSSGARTLVDKSPLHFAWRRENGRADTKAFDYGRAAHMEVLGVGGGITVCEFDSWRTNASKDAREAARAAGSTPLLPHEAAKVRAMAAKLRAHKVAGPMLARPGRAELTLVYRDAESGVMCRVRVDFLPDVASPARPIVIDYKSTTDASPAACAKAMASYGYHQQLDFYIEALLALGMVDEDQPPALPLIVWQEKDEPFAVNITSPSGVAMDWGKTLNRKARDLYRVATESGEWRGYENPYGATPIDLPGWLLSRYEIAQMAGDYDTDKDSA